MPTAKPIGQIVGPGTCGPPSPSASVRQPPSLSHACTRASTSIQAARIMARQRRNSRCKRRPRPLPAAEDAAQSRFLQGRNRSAPLRRARCRTRPSARSTQLAHLGRHLDLRRPFARALGRPLRRRVDADLAADELQRRRVVEVVGGPFREQHVALRVDVRAHVEEDLLVVVHVDVLVHDHDRLRQATASRAPRSRA